MSDDAIRIQRDGRDVGVRLCTCCLHTEHVTFKDKAVVVVVPETSPCRRCGQPCQNSRCDQLPTNPDGRGYGPVPRKRRG